ncbi:hypothetical protein [uncultured Jatrophihabitans sp.]|uniref:hypothetical protein n=1 Tax=uncultured Jatrophihabitans sp. TaxID=1610747 RepID=UPI0035C9B0E2
MTLVALLLLATAPQRAGASTALRRYEATGVRTSGGANPVDAPDLAPGLYRDTYAQAGAPYEDGTAKYYRVRLRKGVTPYFSVTEAPAGRASDKDSALRVELSLAPVDRSVSGCEASASGTGDATGDDLDNATAVLAPGEVGGPDWEDCPTDAVYALHVTRSGSAFTGAGLSMEIAVRLEPAGSATGSPAVGEDAKNVRGRAGGPLRVVVGGTGFGTAPLLPAGRYRDSFVTGERRYYRVHLDWGQRVAWTLTADQLPEVSDYRGTRGTVLIANPVREVVEQPDDADVEASDLGATSGPVYGSTLVPTAWVDRRSDDDDVVPYAMDGDYYLIVSTAYPDSTQLTSTVPYELNVQILGARTQGPTYAVDGSAVPHTGSGHRAVLVSAVIGGVVVVLVVVLVAVLLLKARRRQRSTQT